MGALDSVMELLDDRIELNERTMKSMRLGLETIKIEDEAGADHKLRTNVASVVKKFGRVLRRPERAHASSR